VYDPPTGNWYPTSPLLVQRANHAATLLPNGRVLVAGGHDPSVLDPHLNSAEVYNPVTLEWTPIAPLHVARSFHTMTLLLNGYVLVAGGASGPLQSVRSAEVYDSALTCSAITVYPPSAPPATQGAAYTALFGQTGSSGITLWSLSAGTLPNGLALNTANGGGVLAGVPTAAGTFHFTVRATNGNCVGERAYTLVVTGMSATAAPSPLP
jgi:Putative Ig domain/Kelch motif